MVESIKLIMKVYLYLSSLLFVFCTCQNTTDKKIATASILKEIVTPCKEGGEPNLFVSETGQVYLSWIEYLNDTTDALLFSKLEDNEWTAPQPIASGSDWFVNWADFPSLVAYKKDNGQSLAAHWLQTSAAGTYDYDVRIAQSFDAGKTWNPSFIPHRDSIPSEHGFVSMLPLSENKIFAAWLDGRNTKGEGHSEEEHGHHGAMTLRAATFDKEAKLYDEVELDSRVCDCCQTSVARTDKGLIVAYRDRSEDEIRDIAIVRQVNGEWTSPSLLFKDNWYIPGCPVNGPSIKADGATVAIAWFTNSDEKPKIKVAFSNNSGERFSLPIRVDEGKPLGRVDILLLSDKEALVSWVEEMETSAAIKAVKVNAQGRTSEVFLVASTKASRQSGFPRMVRSKKQIVFAWTAVDSLTRVRTAILNIN